MPPLNKADLRRIEQRYLEDADADTFDELDMDEEDAEEDVYL